MFAAALGMQRLRHVLCVLQQLVVRAVHDEQHIAGARFPRLGRLQASFQVSLVQGLNVGHFETGVQDTAGLRIAGAWDQLDKLTIVDFSV